WVCWRSSPWPACSWSPARWPAAGSPAPRRSHRAGADGPAPSARPLEVISQALAQKQPRAVHTRLHRGQADGEELRDLRVRAAFHVVEDEGGPIVGRQTVDRLAQPLPGLGLDGGVLERDGPVADLLEVMAVGVEGREEGLPRDLLLSPAAAQLL